MSHVSLRHTAPLAIVIVVILALLAAACGGTAPTPTVAPVATKASAAAGGAASVSFAKDVLPIFQKNCTRCHGGSKLQSGVSLESYQNVMASGKVVAGDANNSRVYILTSNGTMPFGGPKLSGADEQKIQDWINVGALNN